MVNSDSLKICLDSLDIRYKENPKSYILTCPKCNKSQKLYIRKSDGRFVCWSCQEINNYRGFNVERPIADISHEPIQIIKNILYGSTVISDNEFLSITIDDPYDYGYEKETVWDKIRALPTLEYPLNFYPLDHPFSARGVKYLEKRNINLELAKLYDIRYCPDERRIIFPMWFRKDLYGWQGRTIVPSSHFDEELGKTIHGLKVRSSDNFPKQYLWMFMDNLEGYCHALITEGPVDAIKGHLCGGNIASAGKGISYHQMELLDDYKLKSLYLGLDPDAAKEMSKLLHDYNHKWDIYLLDIKKKDLGECTLEEAKELFDKALKIQNSHLIIYFDQH